MIAEPEKVTYPGPMGWGWESGLIHTDGPRYWLFRLRRLWGGGVLGQLDASGHFLPAVSASIYFYGARHKHQ